MPLVICGHCGASFKIKQSRIDQGKGVFCSRECFWASRRTGAIIRRCARCARVFSAKSEGELYCSCKCRKEAESDGVVSPRQKVAKRYCRICETAFEPQYKEQTFCSKACEAEYNSRNGNILLEDPWATGAIPPDRYDYDYYRMPDLWLGF